MRIASRLSSLIAVAMLTSLSVFVFLITHSSTAHAYGSVDGIVKVTVTIAPADTTSSIIVKLNRSTSAGVGDNEIILTRTGSNTFTGDLNNAHLSCSTRTPGTISFTATVYNNSGGGFTGQTLDQLGTSGAQNICNDPETANFSVNIRPVGTTPGNNSTGTVCGTLSYYNPDTKQVMPYVTDNSNIAAVPAGSSTGPKTKTDNNGKYCIGNLSPGTYKLVTTYTSPQGKSMDTWTSTDFQVTAGKTTTIDHAATAPGQATGTGSATTDTKETCTVAGIGWVVCPLMTFIGKTIDAVYTLIEQMMVFNIQDPFGNNPLKQIWGNILGIANIVFVIAFFAVIFSQATSVGINNYGIKKMLPRMIAAAILVNLSYYICLLAIDASNILGAGIDGVLMNALPSAQSTNLSWSTVIVGALAGTAVAVGLATGALVAILAPFAGTALLAVVTTLVILVARQAILIMLIVLSPLAFVAFILPGTSEWFDKWKKMFITMLVFYPLVTLLFSGSKVAAYIMQQANNGGISGALVQVFALAVMTFPLFATPFLLKFSGGLIGRIAGVVNNPNKGPFDRINKAGQAASNRIRGEAADAYDSNPKTRNKMKNFRSRLITGTPYLGIGAAAKARTQATLQQRGDTYGSEERKIALSSFSARGISGDKEELYRIARDSKNKHEQFAAMLQLGEIGAADKLEDLYRGEKDPTTGARLGARSIDHKKAAAGAIAASAGKLASTANPLFFDAATYQSQIKQGKTESDATNQANKTRREKVTSQMGANYLKNLRADQIAAARQSITELGGRGAPAYDTAVNQVEATMQAIGKNINTLNDMTDEQIVEIGKMAAEFGISSSTIDAKFVNRYKTAAASLQANKPSPAYDPIRIGPTGAWD